MALIIKCIRGEGKNEAESIQATLAITEAMAKAVGKRYLDDPDKGGYYRIQKRSFTTIPKPGVRVGHWIFVHSTRYGYSDYMKIVKYEIVIQEDAVMANIEAIRYI